MERLTIQVGGFEVNCSILSENGKAWIVDPGQEPNRILALLKERTLTPAAILLTHAHFDHIGAVPALQTAYPDLSVYFGDADRSVITHPLNQLPPDYPPVGKPGAVSDSRKLKDETGLAVDVIETPGHTPGGVCYFFSHPSSTDPRPWLFSGDTLFAGSVGRTDLPGGDMATLMGSLRKLTALPDDTLVIPGHGMHTRIALEKSGNPFLQ